MHPKIAVLLRRLLPLVSTAPAVAAESSPADLPPSPSSSDPTAIQSHTPKVKKLVYGLARAGHKLLATHRSHSSHSSHRSHSSHYSGSSGGGSYPSTTPSPTPPPAKTERPPAPAKAKAEESAPVAPDLARVLAKLPKVRSQWPAEARLTKVTQFTLKDGDKDVGVVRLEEGTRVKIVAIKLEHAVVRIGATESTIPVPNTDVIDRMGGAEKILALPDEPETKETAK